VARASATLERVAALVGIVTQGDLFSELERKGEGASNWANGRPV
jgi:hypothetical protein